MRGVAGSNPATRICPCSPTVERRAVNPYMKVRFLPRALCFSRVSIVIFFMVGGVEFSRELANEKEVQNGYCIYIFN